VPIELAPHQCEAVARLRLLLAIRGGALLADEVGLGKSFIAAAVAAERQRGGNEVELIVPAALIAQWRETAYEFGLDARILTHDALRGDPFVPDPSRERLVVVDEAHAFRNRATQRWRALARRTAGARLLLVTATPICNALDDLAALVALLAADDALRDCGVHSIEAAFRERDAGAVAAVVAALVLRRERDVLPPALRFGALERRIVRHPVFDAAAIDALQFPLVGECALLRRLLWRRLESSEEALVESIDRQLRFYDRALDAMRRGRTLTKRDYRAAFGGGESLQQVLFWELFAPAGGGDSEAVVAEVARLTRLRAEVAASPRAKLHMLLDLARSELIDEPYILFTAATATARALHAALPRSALASAHDRRAIEDFRRGRVQVLVATDLAAEGLNLQRAGTVVHYDIPWNPVKLDQRNGRAHRIGQRRAAVQAIYFVPEIDRGGVVEVLAGKNIVRHTTLRSGAAARRDAISSPLPSRLPRDGAQAALVRALESRGLRVPELLLRPHRAGLTQLIGEMASEYLDAGRVNELAALLEREREIAHL
jgi:hypothetical protein